MVYVGYDSTEDTKEHQRRVAEMLTIISLQLLKRGTSHDDSKLEDPEKEMFDRVTPLLALSTYGSPEYKETLAEMKEGLEHHYEKNSHHPEHYVLGIREMTLMDIVEMFCDWKAASLRHEDGSMEASIQINKKRFQIHDQLANIFRNTAHDLGWMKEVDHA